MMDIKKILVLDTETTGFDSKAEILQLSVIDGSGEIRINEYFRPRFISSWPGAEAVNHISPEIVKDKPSFYDRREEIGHLLRHADLLVGYNLPFDLKMIRQNGVFIPYKAKTLDLMRPFAKVYGEINEKYGDYKWQKLSTCAKYYGCKEEGWHDSLADTKATLFCFHKMLEAGHIKL